MKQKKNPELFEFRTYVYIVYFFTLYYTKSLSPELVCEIRGYEQLLNCCFQITTFICLLVFFIFSICCGISTCFYNYYKVTKNSVIVKYFLFYFKKDKTFSLIPDCFNPSLPFGVRTKFSKPQS